MFVDSHCHLDFPELRSRLPALRAAMHAQRVTHALCISVQPETLPDVLEVSRFDPNWYASVGVHPDYELAQEPQPDQLLQWSLDPKVVAIGETGLDYFRRTDQPEWQRERFRTHIRVARAVGKPLVVHTRAAPEDTLRILREEGAASVGGVLHCFTESLEVANSALELGFHISFSGILTFKNARQLKEVAQKIPWERILIETDAPYLAPAPHRGQINEPGWVRYVAEELATLRGCDVEEVGEQTSHNFFRLFGITA